MRLYMELCTAPACIKGKGLLKVPHSHYKCRGDRASSVAAPKILNSFLLAIRSADSSCV